MWRSLSKWRKRHKSKIRPVKAHMRDMLVTGHKYYLDKFFSTRPVLFLVYFSPHIFFVSNQPIFCFWLKSAHVISVSNQPKQHFLAHTRSSPSPQNNQPTPFLPSITNICFTMLHFGQPKQLQIEIRFQSSNNI